MLLLLQQLHQVLVLLLLLKARSAPERRLLSLLLQYRLLRAFSLLLPLQLLLRSLPTRLVLPSMQEALLLLLQT